MDWGGPGRYVGSSAVFRGVGFQLVGTVRSLLTGELQMQSFLTRAQRFMRDEDGATMVEYALMLALIAVVCIVAVAAIGTGANGMFTTIGNDL